MHIAGKIFIGLGLLITLAGVGLVIGGGSNLSDVGQWDVEEKSQFEGTEGSMTYQFSGDDMMIMVRDDVVCKEFEFEMTKGAAAALAVNYTDNETTLILNDASSFPNEGSGSIWDEEGQNNVFNWTSKTGDVLNISDLDSNYSADSRVYTSDWTENGVTISCDDETGEPTGSDDDPKGWYHMGDIAWWNGYVGGENYTIKSNADYELVPMWSVIGDEVGEAVTGIFAGAAGLGTACCGIFFLILGVIFALVLNDPKKTQITGPGSFTTE